MRVTQVIIFLVLPLLSTGAVADIQRMIKENYAVHAQGYADLWRNEIIYDDSLRDLFVEYYDGLIHLKSSQDEYKKELAEGIQLHYAKRSHVNIPTYEKNKLPPTFRTKIRVDGLAVREESDPLVYTITHKPFTCDNFNPDAPKPLCQRFLEYYLDDMLFQSIFLESVKEDSLTTEFQIHYSLPEGSELINRNELEKYQSRGFVEVKVGDLFTIKSMLDVEANDYIILSRIITVFRDGGKQLRSDKRVMEELFRKFVQLERFQIKYKLPNRAEALSVRDIPEYFKRDFSRTWTPRLNASSFQPIDLSNGDKVLQLEGDAEVDTKLLLRWNWRYFNLQDFEAIFEVKPSINVFVKTEIQEKKKTWKSKEIELFSPRKTVSFWVGTFPVVADFYTSLSVEVSSVITASAIASIGLEYKPPRWGIGCRYTQNITAECKKMEVTMDRSLQIKPNLQAELNALVTGNAPIRLGAKLYKTAGPYISIAPKIELKGSVCPNNTPPVDVEFNATATISGGLSLAGWLSELLDSPAGTLQLTGYQLKKVVLGKLPCSSRAVE